MSIYPAFFCLDPTMWVFLLTNFFFVQQQTLVFTNKNKLSGTHIVISPARHGSADQAMTLRPWELPVLRGGRGPSAYHKCIYIYIYTHLYIYVVYIFNKDFASRSTGVWSNEKDVRHTNTRIYVQYIHKYIYIYIHTHSANDNPAIPYWNKKLLEPAKVRVRSANIGLLNLLVLWP